MPSRRHTRPKDGDGAAATCARRFSYFIAENLATRADEFAARVGRAEVDASVARCSRTPAGPTSGTVRCTILRSAESRSR